MAGPKNILFIMADQLRYDYLGCTGHPTIKTPHIDALAARGVNFSRTYCQAAVCGPSRMSFYTGRYMFTHGGTYNNIPVRVDERTMGDHLRPLGYRVGLVGKTHFRRDVAGMEKLGISPSGDLGILLSESGFEPWERDDGLHPDQSADPDLAYNRYLREKGYEGGGNPWHTVANSAEGPDGEVLSGWNMRNVGLPARVARAHSETAYMTDLAMAKIEELGAAPWCMHLSYIKPHWPYMAPDPYHAMYGPNMIQAANRDEKELENRHPVVDAFGQHEESVNFSRDECRETVIPAYMGLISELDDHVGRLMAFLKERGQLDNTIVVLTSDHGDYLGDHWLGEKELFYDAASRIPMIVVDPDASADETRGTRDDRLVESIDLIPTFMDLAGCEEIPDHWLEGRSLAPLLRGDADVAWRDAAFCECDYAVRHARNTLALGPEDCRSFMIRTDRWKFILYEGFRPQLFDMENDPGELVDLGEDPAQESVRREMSDRIFEWMRKRKLRTALSNKEISNRTGMAKERGYLFGVW
jgi:arylsulfatase A-like enzyme